MSNSDHSTVDYIKTKLLLLKQHKKTIIFVTVFTVVLTGLEAFTTYNEYDTPVSMIPELPAEQGSVAGNLLKQFGGLSGLGIGGSLSINTTIPPQLYAKVVNSTPFLLHLLEQRIYFGKYDEEIQVFEYFEEYHRTPVISFCIKYLYDLPWTLLRGNSSNDEMSRLKDEDGDLISLTKSQQVQIANLQKRITVTLDPKTGVLRIIVRMPDRIASAKLSNIVLDYLKNYITDYQNEKAQQEFDFIQGQLVEAKTRFEESQNNLAEFRDKNYYISSAKQKIKEERLTAEYNLHFGVYSNLAQQFEQSKIKLNQSTPLFKVLEPAKISIEKSAPSRLLMLSISLILGLLLGFGIVLLRPELKALIDIYRKS